MLKFNWPAWREIKKRSRKRKFKIYFVLFYDFVAATRAVRANVTKCFRPLPPVLHYLWDSIDWIKNIWQKLDLLNRRQVGILVESMAMLILMLFQKHSWKKMSSNPEWKRNVNKKEVCGISGHIWWSNKHVEQICGIVGILIGDKHAGCVCNKKCPLAPEKPDSV